MPEKRRSWPLASDRHRCGPGVACWFHRKLLTLETPVEHNPHVTACCNASKLSILIYIYIYIYICGTVLSIRRMAFSQHTQRSARDREWEPTTKREGIKRIIERVQRYGLASSSWFVQAGTGHYSKHALSLSMSLACWRLAPTRGCIEENFLNISLS